MIEAFEPSSSFIEHPWETIGFILCILYLAKSILCSKPPSGMEKAAEALKRHSNFTYADLAFKEAVSADEIRGQLLPMPTEYTNQKKDSPDLMNMAIEALPPSVPKKEKDPEAGPYAPIEGGAMYGTIPKKWIEALAKRKKEKEQMALDRLKPPVQKKEPSKTVPAKVTSSNPVTSGPTKRSISASATTSPMGEKASRRDLTSSRAGGAVSISSSVLNKETKCPFCATFPKKPVVCASCSTPHCGDCWDLQGGCSVYACKASDVPLEEVTHLSKVDKPKPRKRNPSEWLFDPIILDGLRDGLKEAREDAQAEARVISERLNENKRELEEIRHITKADRVKGMVLLYGVAWVFAIIVIILIQLIS